jgi:hypothetical protein
LVEETMAFKLEMTAESKIEDPRGHSAETLLRLRRALACGAPAAPDAGRPGFFEIQAGDQVFYIHVSPATQKIMLLATWSHEPELEIARSA